MANKERGEVTILLDKERTLKFTLNSLIYIEEQGVSLTDLSKNGNVKLKDLRSLLYAGLIHEDDTLIPEQVGNMIELDKIQEISDALNKAFNTVGK